MDSFTAHGKETSQGRIAATAFVVLGLCGLLLGVSGPVRAQEGPCAGPPSATSPDGGIDGTPGPDVLVGTRGPDFVDGKGGDDVLCGLGLTDILVGGPGNDTLYGGYSGDADLSGGGGDDTIYGGGGRDDVSPGPGDDRVSGEDGAALVSYRGDRGPISADLRNGVIEEPRGTDVLIGVAGIWGSREADTLVGSRLDDSLIGDSGRDHMKGLGGSDLLLGTAGRDVASGGHGRDRCSAERLRSCERRLELKPRRFGAVVNRSPSPFHGDLLTEPSGP